ncbi:LTA synthase family protein [Dysosmobacter sp.]
MRGSRKKRVLCLPLLAVGLTAAVELLNHKVSAGGLAPFWSFITDRPLALAVDILLVLITLLPGLFLRRQVFWWTLVSAVWLVMGAVNGFILLNRMTPFTIADLTVLNTGLDTLPNYLSGGYLVLLGAAAAALLAVLAGIFVKGRRCTDGRRQRAITGAAALGAALAALGGSWALAFHAGQLSGEFANLAYAYEDYGFPYCFLQTWLNKGIRRPGGYGPGSMNRIAGMVESEIPANAASAQPDVNVVYVQLESFVDPGEIQGLTLSRDPVPNWTALTKAYSSGYLTVPVVGAGTANTECEVLTGMSTRMFGPGEYPYQTCLLDRTVESVAYDLKEHGYAAHAIHNHYATFYRRNEVYANLGFDDFTSLEYMPKTETTPQGWAKDSVLTGEILDALDATPGQADLVFAVSVQGHGKYPDEPVLTDPAIGVLACPDEQRRDAVEYYVNQIHEMDGFVGRLTKALAQRPEKTMLILYGDHLPSLGLEGSDMKSGSLYRTRYLIWDNFGLPRREEDLAAYQLSASALGRIGVTNGTMNAFHQFCREESTYRSDLRLIQYDQLYGGHYLAGTGAVYPPTELRMGVLPITLVGLSREGGAWLLFGQNFTPYCKVTRGDRVLKTQYISPWLLRLLEDPETEDVQELAIRVVDRHRQILSDTE